MTLSRYPATTGSVPFLTEQWRAASLAGVWLRPGDWSGPATHAMVAAIVTRKGVEEASGGLGAERARRGVGLIEGLEDLSVLFHIIGIGDPPFVITRAFSGSWVEVTTAGLLDRSSVDALTGLVTRDYLLPRVREVYADAAGRGIRVDDERCLIVIDKSEHDIAGWQRVMREGKVGRVLSTVFDRGETNSVLPSGTFLSIVPRNDSLEEHLVRIKMALSRDIPEGTARPTVRIEPLPPTVGEAEKLLLAL